MWSPCCRKPSHIISKAGRYAGAVVQRCRVCSNCGKKFVTHESLIARTAPPCKKRCFIVAELTQKVEELEEFIGDIHTNATMARDEDMAWLDLSIEAIEKMGLHKPKVGTHSLKGVNRAQERSGRGEEGDRSGEEEGEKGGGREEGRDQSTAGQAQG